MLRQVTISTKNVERFKPLLRSALEREVHLVEYAILKTRERLAEFEKLFDMETAEFERRFNADDLGETLDFIEWWGEAQTLHLLDEKKNIIKSAQIK